MTTRTLSFPIPSFTITLRQVWSALCEMQRARAMRRVLADMDDRTLADIGASRAFAQYESGRAFYDIHR